MIEELYVKYNYPSVAKFVQILKANGKSFTNKEVKDFISKQSVAQVHKPIQNIKSNQKFIFALEPLECVQIDLLDYQKYAAKNKGYRYILIAIDIFTRYLYTASIKDKKPESVL